MRKKSTQWLIKWRRPCDDSWFFHIPKKTFETEKELKKHLKDNSETKGVEFIILNRIS